MWLLTQLFEIVLVIAGLNVLWDVLRAPFRLLEKRKTQRLPDNSNLKALQKAALVSYGENLRASLAARTSAKAD